VHITVTVKKSYVRRVNRKWKHLFPEQELLFETECCIMFTKHLTTEQGAEAPQELSTGYLTYFFYSGKGIYCLTASDLFLQDWSMAASILGLLFMTSVLHGGLPGVLCLPQVFNSYPTCSTWPLSSMVVYLVFSAFHRYGPLTWPALHDLCPPWWSTRCSLPSTGMVLSPDLPFMTSVLHGGPADILSLPQAWSSVICQKVLM